MSAVTQTGRAPVPMDTLGIDIADAGAYGSGEGMFASIDHLIAQIKKIGVSMRDLERQFAETMQRVAFDRQILALETKKEAIGLNYKAAMASALSQIAGGVVSASGAFSSVGGSLTTGLSDAGKGIAGVANASMTSEAQQAQMLGDFQDQSAQQFQKSLATTTDRALEASRQMRDATRDLVSLQQQLASAVRF
jgi:secreted effector protein SseD